MVKVIISDEKIGGKIISQIELMLESEVITLRELIFARVKKEIQEIKSNKNSSQENSFNSNAMENALNENSNKYNIEDLNEIQQGKYACQSFKKNAFFVIVDNEQIEHLDQEIIFDETTKVSFIRLVPMIGG